MQMRSPRIPETGWTQILYVSLYEMPLRGLQRPIRKPHGQPQTSEESGLKEYLFSRRLLPAVLTEALVRAC